MTGGKIIVVSGPSGSGKGTVIGKLLSINGALALSISYTSRRPRQGELDGVHYHFVTKERFAAMIGGGEFVEWDLYQGDYYGTSKAEIEKHIRNGEDVIFDITIKGAYAIRDYFPDAALVFMLPPSFSELEKRLRRRGTETEEKIAGRLAEAGREILALENFNYFIINDDADEAARKLDSILTAEKHRVGAGETAPLIEKIITKGNGEQQL